MWPTLNAVHPVVPTMFNRRTPTVWEEDIPVPDPKERDTVSFQRRDRTYNRMVSTGPGGKDERMTVPAVEHKRTKDMTSAACAFAGKIAAGPFRITGALGAGAANRPWVSAVAQSLIKLGIGGGRHRQWQLCFSQRLSRSDTIPAECVASLVSLIHQWGKASEPFQVKETLDTPEVITAVPDTEIDTLPESVPSGLECFVRAITLDRNASTLSLAHVCPHSLFFTLAGESCRPIDVQGNRYSELPQSAIFDILSGPSSRSNKAGWLAAAAAAHNKEQHALNGNIDNVLTVDNDAINQFTTYRELFRNGPSEQACGMFNDCDLIRRAYDASLWTFCSDGPYEYYNVITNVATAHQFIGVTEEQMAGGPVPHDEMVSQFSDAASTSGTIRPMAGHAGSPLSSGEHENEALSPRAETSGYASATSRITDASDVTLQAAMSDDTITREIKAALSRAEDTTLTASDKKRRKSKKSQKARHVRDTLPVGGAHTVRGAAPDEPPAAKPLHMGVLKPFDTEIFARISSKLKWVAVGQDSRFNKGGLKFTTPGQFLMTAGTNPPNPFVPGGINPGIASLLFGHLINCPHITEVLRHAQCQVVADIRALALKVALLDMQRERYFFQPSGVEWAWAKPEVPDREIIDLSVMDQWHYDAVFVTCETIEYAMRNCGLLPVGNGEDQWNITDGSAIIIGLPINTAPGTMGLTTWILSHLTYPLAWVFEYFDMSKVGGGDSSIEVFCSTASLVDMHSAVSKLIFVTPTQSPISVTIGGRIFPFSTVDDHFELPVNQRPQVWNMNNVISTLLRNALACRWSLRKDFDEFVCPMILGGINWLEVDSLVNLLTIRYHQRVEGVKINPKLDTMYIGAPRYTLQKMGLLPSLHIESDSYSDYGAANAVTALDHRVCSRIQARQYPIVSIGVWTNLAELGITSGLVYFLSYNTEDAENIRYRLTSGNLDKIQRSRALRASLELWKRRAGLLDVIAFPLENCKREWADLVNTGKRNTDDPCMLDVAHLMLGDIAYFSWAVNGTLGSAGSTMTGSRLTSSQWRHDYNVSYMLYDPTNESGDGSGKARYLLDHTIGSWAYNKLHQGHTLGGRTDGLEYAICRINLTDHAWDVTYKDQATGWESPGVSFCVDSSHGAILAYEIGIRDPIYPTPPPKNWSWGLRTCIRDFARKQLRTLVIGYDVYSALNCGARVPHTVLLSGDCNAMPISTTSRYFLRECIDEFEKSIFDKVAEFKALVANAERESADAPMPNADSHTGAPTDQRRDPDPYNIAEGEGLAARMREFDRTLMDATAHAVTLPSDRNVSLTVIDNEKRADGREDAAERDGRGERRLSLPPGKGNAEFVSKK
jgi:hypothetical protein